MKTKAGWQARALLLLCVLPGLWPLALAAQDAAPAPAEDVEALIARVQGQLERLDAATAERTKALGYLEQQVLKATGALSASGETTESLRAKAASLDSTVSTLNQDREALATKLEGVEDERARRLRELETRLATLDQTLGESRRRGDSLGTDLEATRAQVASLEAALAAREGRLGEVQASLAERDAAAAAAQADVDRLSLKLAATAQQLSRLAAAVDTSEAKVKQQSLQIDVLGAQLNTALLEQVEELSQYRSEFFGRLRRALGDRADVRVVGDRFVLPSELLFASGSASLAPQGQAELRQLATTLKEVAATIPPDVDWVLRVDGHTDRQPVRPGTSFRSNWELSTERAIAVVEALIAEGVAPQRLAATGFGEFKPLDQADNEAAYQRNRRIELKLTES